MECCHNSNLASSGQLHIEFISKSSAARSIRHEELLIHILPPVAHASITWSQQAAETRPMTG